MKPVSSVLGYAEDVYEQSYKDRRRKFPNKTNLHNRLIPVCIPEIRPKFKIPQDAKFFTIGSCFARHIDQYLDKIGLNSLSFGGSFDQIRGGLKNNVTLNRYSPITINDELATSIGTQFDENPERFLVPFGDVYFDPYTAAAEFADLETSISRRNQIRNLFASVQDADVVIITLGQIEYWVDTETGYAFDSDTIIPAKITDQYPRRFESNVATYDSCRAALLQTLELVRAKGPEKRFLITTSPVPAKRTFREQDAICAYLHAKSMLRTLAQEIADNDPHIDYFPSFEMVMLSDKKVAFREDYIHVRDPMVARIMSHFIMAYIEHPAGADVNVNYALLNASSLRGDGKYEEACAVLEPVIASSGYDIKVVSEFLLSAVRIERIDEAAKALASADKVENPDNDFGFNMNDAVNAAVSAINDDRYEEATARVLLLLRQRLNTLCDASDDVLYSVFSIIEIIRSAEYLQLLSATDFEALIDIQIPSEDDVACRKLINSIIRLDPRIQTAELLEHVETCWKQYKHALLSLASNDVRSALIPPLLTLGMAERAEFLRKLDEVYEYPEN